MLILMGDVQAQNATLNSSAMAVAAEIYSTDQVKRT